MNGAPTGWLVTIAVVASWWPNFFAEKERPSTKRNAIRPPTKLPFAASGSVWKSWASKREAKATRSACVISSFSVSMT